MGHMPETVTAEDGTVFKRPRLLKELSSQTGRTSTLEDNENWALFNINYASSSTTYSGCGTNYIPTQAGLTSLFANNAGNTTKTVQCRAGGNALFVQHVRQWQHGAA